MPDIINYFYMKRFLIILIALSVATLAFAAVSCGRYEDGRPSKSIRHDFNDRYPEAKDVEWDHEAGYWVVSFETGSAPEVFEHEAWYDDSGKWLRTVTEYSILSVPQSIKDLLAASEYGSLPLEDDEVDYFETSSGDVFYRFELWQEGREIVVDVHEDGRVTPATYDRM